MAARIEIKELGDPAHQKEIADLIEALDGAIEIRIDKSAPHVSYDLLATTGKKSRKLSVPTGIMIKAAATDAESAHPSPPTYNSLTTAGR